MNTTLDEIKESLVQKDIPRHIAVIMDGNGRWAKKAGEMRVFGHQQGVESVRNAVEGCVELGVEYLTLYAFSTENWSRPKEEIEALMQILVNSIVGEIETLNKNKIKLNAIGDLSKLPGSCQRTLEDAIDQTEGNDQMTLTLALSYSGRWDIVHAVKQLVKEVTEDKIDLNDVDEKIFSSYLSTSQMPDPELMIRTSGEIRISNFLLWQLAYSELYVTEVLWPDFRKKHLFEAINNYQQRERRFGKTSEQLH